MAVHIAALGDADLGRFCSLIGPDRLTPALVLLHKPDALLMVSSGNEITARASLWWNQVPKHPGKRIGLIGHYAVRDANAAERALTAACGALADARCTLAVGPMDGSTWRRYRLITERGERPLFFLEPDNPDEWPLSFVQQGFFPLTRYFSAENENISRCSSYDALAKRLEETGVLIRTFNMSGVDQELERLWQVAKVAFEQNFFYTPIEKEEFRGIYSSLLPVIRPELVFLAEKHGLPVGFCFAVPDVLQARRGLSVDTVVLKTLAVVPDCRGLGLGTLLLSRSTQAALELGMHRAIHALMHENNPSRKIEQGLTREFRVYTLFARDL
jgi:GNAT superfamily N-acetyltransferase